MSATETKAAVDTHLQSPKVSSVLLTMFQTVFLPILPGLLQQLAPKIVGNPKTIAVLKQVDQVLDGLIGEE